MTIPWFGGVLSDIYDEVAFGPPPGDWVFYGRVDIDGGIGYKLDSKHCPGNDGVKHTYQGYTAANVTIGLMLHDEESMRAFEALLAVIRPRPGKTIPPPIEVHHPWLDMYSLSQFLVPKISMPKPIAPQMYEVKLGCIEWFAQGSTVAGKVGEVPRYVTRNNFNQQSVIITPQSHPRPSKKGTKKP